MMPSYYLNLKGVRVEVRLGLDQDANFIWVQNDGSTVEGLKGRTVKKLQEATTEAKLWYE